MIDLAVCWSLIYALTLIHILITVNFQLFKHVCMAVVMSVSHYLPLFFSYLSVEEYNRLLFFPRLSQLESQASVWKILKKLEFRLSIMQECWSTGISSKN